MPAADSRQLQLQISASAELMVRQLKQADNAIAGFQRQTDARLTTIDGKFERLASRGMPALTRTLEAGRTSLAGFAAAAGVAGLGAAGATFLQLADRAKAMQAQLRLATAEFGTFGQAQADVERIAAATRISPIKPTTASRAWRTGP